MSKFGPYGGGCNEDGTWRYGTCTLKLEAGGSSNTTRSEVGEVKECLIKQP